MGATDATVLVIGRGIVGSVAAWRAAEAGFRVTCLDPEPGGGASFAAAGMLAPVTEAEFGERDLLPINVAAADAWPGFAAEVEERSGRVAGLTRCGLLMVAYDADDARQLARLRDLQRAWGLGVTDVSVGEARRHEPLLGSRIAAASWVAGDHQVDPRRLVDALDTILTARGTTTIPRAATRLLTGVDGSVLGAVDDVGSEHRADLVVLAAGTSCTALLATFEDVAVPVRPVKGQVLRLNAAGLPWLLGSRIVRGFVQQRSVYVVGRPDGEIVVGATSEELPDDRRPTAGGVFGLLRDSRALLPGLDEAAVVECTARARPATPDNVPILGPCARAGLVLATGHYRHGVLQASLTARAFDDLFAERPLDPVWVPADPRRFSLKEPA